MSRFWVWAVLMAIVAAGCGRSGPKLVPVEGTVTLDGKPLPYKSLLFIPDDGTAGNGAGGFTDGDGKYSLLAVVFGVVTDHQGCPPGRYRVVVSEPSIPITADHFGPLDEEDEGDEPAAAVGPAIGPPTRQIPPLYTSEQTTSLTVEVPESGCAVDLQLTSRPGGR